MVKRILWQAFLVLFVGGILAMLAFGPRPLSAIPPGRVRITYWEKWNGLEGQQAQDIVDLFNNTVGKDKNIWVDYVSISEIDRKTLVSTAAGMAPDVSGVWDKQVCQFASMGALEDLGPMAQKHGLTRAHFKPVFYDGCMYKGKLYALPSTVFSVALIYNKEIFQQKAAELRAAGLDPDRPPRTMEELDKYAAAIDTWVTKNGQKHLSVTGFIPLQPGSFTNLYAFWFGGNLVDPTGTKLLLTSPEVEKTYDWLRGYSVKLGTEALQEFNSGFGQFDSPENPFLVGENAMEQEGPWMAAFIEKLKPEMNRWHVPPDQLQREKDFSLLKAGMAREEVAKLLGPGESVAGAGDKERWLAGIKEIYVTYAGGRAASMEMKLLPGDVRQKYSQWGAAAFPSAVPGKENISYAGMDVLVVPSTSKHKEEAYEFIEFMERQENIEKLASLHCNLSPLAEHSANYFKDHPNAYADVWEALAVSPNARPLPMVPNWPQLFDEMTLVADRSNLLRGSTKEILTTAQRRCQMQLNEALNVPANTNLEAAGNGVEK